MPRFSGCGDSGPLRDQPAYDMVIQAPSGALSLTDEPDGRPLRMGTSVADLGGAVFATIGICAALSARSRTGRGQKLDISMLDGQVALLEHDFAPVAFQPTVSTRTGTHHATLAVWRIEASDGDIVFASANDTLFGSLTP
jgi:CoA:oxalate CoA-transferase